MTVTNDSSSADDNSARFILVEVAYALPARQTIHELQVPVGCTAREAAIASKLDALYESLDTGTTPLGIFGNRVEDDYVLEEGDRVELYRPLMIDPMEQRRQRAAKNKSAKSNIAKDKSRRSG